MREENELKKRDRRRARLDRGGGYYVRKKWARRCELNEMRRFTVRGTTFLNDNLP